MHLHVNCVMAKYIIIQIQFSRFRFSRQDGQKLPHVSALL